MKYLLVRRLTAMLLAAPLSLIAAPTPADISPRIVGGVESDAAQWPSVVSLKGKFAKTHFCGGTLIAEKWVLTAAHCMFTQQGNALLASEITATVGEYNLNSNLITPATKIERIVVHPDYNPIGEINDIALLKLAQKSASDSITIVNLQETASLIENMAPARVVGWGSTVAYDAGQVVDPDYPNILREVEIPLNTDQQCTASLGENYTNEMLCAGFSEGGKDSCQGDSGGPLMVSGNYGWQQIGIVSWGIGCASAGKQGVYTRIAIYQNWIDSIINTYSSSANISFLSTAVDSRDVKQINVDNNSDRSTTFTYQISGSEYFSFDNSACLTIAAHSSCQLAVTYAPLEYGIHQATISISSSIAGATKQNVQLRGVPSIFNEIISSSSGSLGFYIWLLIPIVFIRRYQA